MKKSIWIALVVLLTSVSASAQTLGVVCEYWIGKTLVDPSQLATNPNLLGTPTSTSVLSNGFIAPVNMAGSPFVSRCRTQPIVPASGNYRFWIAANKLAALWLSPSPDISRLSPRCRVSASFPTPNPKEWEKNPVEQKSGLINLTAGGTYYITVIHVATSTLNHMAVGWQLPNLVYERPIPATRLKQVSLNPPVTVSLTTDKTTMVQGQAATLTWSSTNALSCTASSVPAYQYWTGSKATTGSQFVTPLVSTTLTLLCQGSGSNGTTSTLITVTPAEVLNPSKVSFLPSADHDIVTEYQLQFYILGAVSQFQTLSMGKPAIGADGNILVDFTTLPTLVSWPLSVGQYQAKVAALNATGVGLSDFSNVFTVAK